MAIRTPEAPGKSDRPERGRGIPAAALPQRRGSVEPIPQMSRDEQLEIVTSALGTEAPTFPRRVLQQQPAALRPEEVVNLQETGGF
ncbi:MAG TPA: hypothetical protein VMR77_00465 [Patescibacteria group bacterium]|jgi:hypothetical protein|nr:hypothetical protein [Patescibacteria group bacterium]